jgi:hypothetical protein
MWVGRLPLSLRCYSLLLRSSSRLFSSSLQWGCLMQRPCSRSWSAAVTQVSSAPQVCCILSRMESSLQCYNQSVCTSLGTFLFCPDKVVTVNLCRRPKLALKIAWSRGCLHKKRLLVKVNSHSTATFSLYPSTRVGCRPVRMHFGLQMLTNFKAPKVENLRLRNAQGLGLGFNLNMDGICNKSIS